MLAALKRPRESRALILREGFETLSRIVGGIFMADFVGAWIAGIELLRISISACLYSFRACSVRQALCLRRYSSG